MANLRTNNLSGEQGQNAYRGSVNFVSKTEADYLQVSANSDLSLTGDFTIEYWTWISDSETHTRQVSSGNYYTAGKNGNWYFGLSPTSGNVVFYTYDAQSNAESVNISQTISLNSWHHAAAVRSGNTVTLYLNGVSIGSGTVSKDLVDGADGGLQIGRLTVYGSHMGYISNFRILNGEALYTANFTPPFTELKAIPNTVLLCCQNSDDVTQEETGKTITGNGNLANADFNKSQPKIIPPYGVDAGNTFGGTIQQSSQGYMYFPTGRTEERGRGRGVIMGGYLSPTGYLQDIYYVDIQSTGNAFHFGDLTASRYSGGGCGSSTRGLIGGGRRSNGDRIDVIESIEFAITSNSIDFGDLVAGNSFCPGGGNQTRGIWMGGSNGSTTFDTIQFATIATTGNAQDFGDLRAASYAPATAASPTRMLAMGGGNPSSFFAYIDFVEIATTGNAQDFGDMSTNKNQNTGVSSNTRAVAMGGNTPSGLVNSMEFVTIATTGDATDFGDLTFGGVEHTGSVNNSIRGVQTGGRYPSYNNIMEFITIASTGNGSDFGDIPITGIAYVAGASDSHGGLS